MDMIAAAKETMQLAQANGMNRIDVLDFADPSLSFKHLNDHMLPTMQKGDMSEGKLGRWLGWMQCACVAADVGFTLDAMKDINLKHAGPTSNIANPSVIVDGRNLYALSKGELITMLLRASVQPV